MEEQNRLRAPKLIYVFSVEKVLLQEIPHWVQQSRINSSKERLVEQLKQRQKHSVSHERKPCNYTVLAVQNGRQFCSNQSPINKSASVYCAGLTQM